MNKKHRCKLNNLFEMVRKYKGMEQYVCPICKERYVKVPLMLPIPKVIERG